MRAGRLSQLGKQLRIFRHLRGAYGRFLTWTIASSEVRREAVMGRLALCLVGSAMIAMTIGCSEESNAGVALIDHAVEQSRLLLE